MASTHPAARLTWPRAAGGVSLGGQAGGLLARHEATDGLAGDVVRPNVGGIFTAVVIQLVLFKVRGSS